MKSTRLKQLVTLTTEEEWGLVPDMEEAIKELDYLVVWKKVVGLKDTINGEDEIPEPRRGIDEQFDEANDRVAAKKKEMVKYLESLKVLMRAKAPSKHAGLVNQVKYAHARYRYEIEVPNELVKGEAKLEDFVVTSQKTGFTRFHTDRLKEHMDELDALDEIMREAITPFICAIFQRFYENRKLWKPAVMVL